MVLIANRGRDAVLRAEVAHEDGDDQGIRLVARHLDEAGGAQPGTFVLLEVTEVLHLEKRTRLSAGDPWLAAPPCPGTREGRELIVDPLELMLGQAVQAVVEDPRHSDKTTDQGGGRGAVRAWRIVSSCHGGAWTVSERRSAPAASRKSPRRPVSRKVR